ncbi:MAG: EFR1 family ferrodoxin [Clostridia bacterium]|nr:EFR1 family ferrodoxin [Clostridia bacterium]
MIGVYFSGTGNTKHCVEKLCECLDATAEVYSIEDESVLNAIKQADKIVFAYPIYYSYLPKIVYDFIVNHAELWHGKSIFILATMGLFSGDGAGCSARLFKKYGAKILGGLHLKMPDCIGDVKALKKSLDDNRRLVKNADDKITAIAKRIKSGKYPKDGLSFAHRMAGLFGQRLYFRRKTKKYNRKIKVDASKCVACGKCSTLCPMQNITIQNESVAFNNKCTTCYRCFANCPTKAITIIGKRIYEQCKFENYI